jgi:hypothetical protein
MRTEGIFATDVPRLSPSDLERMAAKLDQRWDIIQGNAVSALKDADHSHAHRLRAARQAQEASERFFNDLLAFLEVDCNR